MKSEETVSAWSRAKLKKKKKDYRKIRKDTVVMKQR